MLKVWLPGIDNFDDQGLGGITWINHNVTIENNGKIGKCFNFDGSQSSYISTTSKFIESDKLSICFWIYLDNTSGNKGVMNGRNAVNSCFAIYMIEDKIRIDTGTNWLTGQALSAMTWAHVCFTVNGNKQILYINGNQVASRTATFNYSTIADFFTIGCEHNNGTSIGTYFSGCLNDIRIYDTALSVREIKEIAKGLVRHYTLSGVTNNQIYGETITDNATYSYRKTSAAGNVGKSEFNTIIGQTVGWNQYLSSQHLPSDSALYGADTYSANNVTFTKQSDGGYLLSTTSDGATADTSVKIGKSSTIPTLTNNGHVFYFALSGSPTASQCCINYSSYNVPKYSIARRSSSTGFNMWLKIMSGTVITNAQKVYPMVIDLTTMFGLTISDYIYNLEQSTTGAGVAVVRQLLTKDYYPYCAPTMKSVTGLVSHDTTGSNILGGLTLGQAIVDAVDRETNSYLGSDSDGNYVTFAAGNVLTNKCFTRGVRFKENAQYTFLCTMRKDPTTSTATNIIVKYTDGTVYQFPLSSPGTKQTKAFVTSSGKTVEGFYTAYYGGRSYLYYDETGFFEGVITAADFEPYVKHTYPLDSALTLRGIMKLDGSTIYADGDAYKPDGTVTRRYGVHVFTGTETLTMLSAQTEGWAVFAYNPSPACMTTSSGVIDITDVGDVVSYPNFSTANLTRRLVTHYGSGIRFALPFTSVANARADLNGKILVYKLATPTTEIANPYISPQICDVSGTERYVQIDDTDGVSIPPGHETKYVTPEIEGGNYTYDGFLAKMGVNDNIEYDVSGYKHNGTKNGSFTNSSDTARYSSSSVFDGSTTYIESEALTTETKTISLWIKMAVPSGNSVIFADYGSKIGCGFNQGNSLIVTTIASSSTGSRVSLGGYYNNNDWNHIVIIKTGENTFRVWLNGNELSPTSNNYWAHSTNNLMIGKRSSGTYCTGQVSDFRAYATALSEDDIMELYQVGASLANNGVLMAHEFIE